MDVRAENRGRPHQKVRFPAVPVVGRNFLTPGHSGVRVRNVRRKSGPKSLCLCCFFLPDLLLSSTLFCVHLHVSASDRVRNDRGWELHNTAEISTRRLGSHGLPAIPLSCQQPCNKTRRNTQKMYIDEAHFP